MSVSWRILLVGEPAGGRAGTSTGGFSTPGSSTVQLLMSSQCPQPAPSTAIKEFKNKGILPLTQILLHLCPFLGKDCTIF
jgi:hypothetical protein